MRETTIDKYLQLRLLIGYLGEAAQYGWWSTSFFIPTSKQFLEPVFARTYRLAQYHGVSEAARQLHDERIGIGNVFHLFRLPEEMERELHEIAADQSRVENLFGDLANKDAALQSLATLADGTKSLSEGPVNIGEISEILKNKVLKEVARCYLAAFEQDAKTYPYFMGNRERK
ncbi:MAG: BrxE family protein [Acidobacteria bacterium]|nr:BrxE family protein [Acidobacteriota bacterium]